MRKKSYVIAACVALVLSILTMPNVSAQPRFTVLVFSKVNGFVHDSIPAGKQAITELGEEHGFDVTITDDAAVFTDQGLEPFDAVVFNNTNSRDGAILDANQRAAFERYIQAGGGYTGIHSASGTEYDWPWYGDLMGAFFKSHPAVQPVGIQVDDQAHPSTRGLPQLWQRTEEPYDFRANPRGNVHVLASLDTRSYTGHTMGADHPISWCQDFDGGRSWYTGLGHDPAAYAEPLFRGHILGGIEWAAGAAAGDCGPTENDRWQKEILEPDTDDPLVMEIDDRGRVFYIQRGGALKVYDPQVGYSHEAGQFDTVMTLSTGMHGMVLDPNFDQNGFIYAFYSARGEDVSRVTRVRFDEATNTLDMTSEVQLFEFFSQRQINGHEGGGMAFDSAGNLYVATGDNAEPCCDGYAPIDERPGRVIQDAQATSANTNDMRGKILRIHPEDDGTYTVPEGNLFPPGTAKTLPEIYVMGLRNPYRIHIDPETDWLYWGEVGPDAREDNPARGPKGHDEFNLAKQAGNFGWPLCIADNKPYVEFDFATGQPAAPYDCAGGPTNNSPNNTGLTQLPPVRPARIGYPYDASPEWPELGTLPHHRLVVDDQNPGHACRSPPSSGNAASTANPPSVVGSAVSVPPSILARSRIPTSPCLGRSSSVSVDDRIPAALRTDIRSRSSSTEMSTVIAAPGACRALLLSASCTIRYADRPTPAGTSPYLAFNAISVPVARSRSTTSSTPRSSGCGVVPAASSSARSAPSIRRISVMPSRAIFCSNANSASTSGSRPGNRNEAESARNASTAMWWVTTSCSSRAMRVRSSSAADRPSSSSRRRSACRRNRTALPSTSTTAMPAEISAVSRGSGRCSDIAAAVSAHTTISTGRG